MERDGLMSAVGQDRKSHDLQRDVDVIVDDSGGSSTDDDDDDDDDAESVFRGEYGWRFRTCVSVGGGVESSGVRLRVRR